MLKFEFGKKCKKILPVKNKLKQEEQKKKNIERNPRN